MGKACMAVQASRRFVLLVCRKTINMVQLLCTLAPKPAGLYAREGQRMHLLCKVAFAAQIGMHFALLVCEQALATVVAATKRELSQSSPCASLLS